MGWLRGLIPRILLPDFTWPHCILGCEPLAQEIPDIPKLPHPIIRLLCGHINYWLGRLSTYYCKWGGFEFRRDVNPLPFGLVIKNTEKVRLEEYLAMQVARAAGFPVPKVIWVGERPNRPFPVSILMTRIPGKELYKVYKDMTEDDRKAVFSELQTIINTMQSWTNPQGDTRICSISGTYIKSSRVPHHKVGPCKNEEEFNRYLIESAWDKHGSPEEYQQQLASAKDIQLIPHEIVFGHGDIAHHNILVHEGHISGLIDWETAGWYPEYWDFTTSMKWMPETYWWYQRMYEIGGKQYIRELASDNNRLNVTSSSWVFG